MTLLNLAKEAGCDIANLVCCVLPYGTGNDLARSLNWGGTEGELKIYKSLPRLVHEICLNAEEKFLNVWTVVVTYKKGGCMMEIDGNTKQYFPRSETVFERYMINYFSMGEDARVGTGFEKKRTKNRCCNNVIYGILGLCNFFCGACCCRRPPLITEQIEYAKSLKGTEYPKQQKKAEEEPNNNYLPLIVEENKEGEHPLLLKDTYQGRILFTTNKKDPNEMHIKKDSVALVGTNIPSYMGGRADPWSQATKIGLLNPY